MSLRGPRCGKHPSHVLVGVCAFCLKERLAGLADVECASDATHTHNSRKKKQSPGRPHAIHASHRQSSEKRGGERPSNNVSVEPIVNKGLQDDHIPRTSSSHTHGDANKGLDKSVVVETMVHATAAKKSNNLPVNKTSSTTLAHEPIISSQSPKTNKASVVSDTSRDESTSIEMPPGRRSFLSTKGPSFTNVDCSKLPPPDIKMPILENDHHTGTECKSSIDFQKHTSDVCTSPLVCVPEQAKLIARVNQVHHAASSDSERKSFNAVHGAKRSLPFPESSVENVKDEEITLSDVSPNSKLKKKTLSSLFSLDDADFPSSKAKVEEAKGRLNVKGEAMSNGSTRAPTQHSLHVKTMQRRCKHGSFSERVDPNTYLFPVPEIVNSKPLSWFSSLFRRRKKKSHPKLVEALASFSEHNNGWEDARQSWEAPRPSSWEQFRFSSFEGPRSSWEPARPSWEGVMRVSDGESVFSGFAESLGDVRDDGLLTQRNQQELAAVDFMNGFSEAKRSLDSNRLGSKSKPLVTKTPHLDAKDRAHSFLPAKATLMQRDVSTQTTPPRASDATELFIQQRLQRSRDRRGQHYVKASHAVWSKVWTKTFSNSKWAFKHKHHKDRRAKDMGNAMMPVDEVHDQGNMTSGRSSFHEGTNTASNHHPKLTCITNIEEHEAWDTFYSPLQQGGDATKRLASKGNMGIQKDEQVGKVRAIDNGLLKFYLTPVRGHGKSKQGLYGL